MCVCLGVANCHTFFYLQYLAKVAEANQPAIKCRFS